MSEPALTLREPAVPGPAGPEAARPGALVVATYDSLARRPGAWVRLARLRAALPGLPRPTLDAALTALFRAGLVQLAPESNRRALRPDDHDAALRLGGEDCHLLCVEHHPGVARPRRVEHGPAVGQLPGVEARARAGVTGR